MDNKNELMKTKDTIDEVWAHSMQSHVVATVYDFQYLLVANTTMYCVFVRLS